MKNLFLRSARVAFFVITLACGKAALAQGPLSPPGAPAPTMKTLQQIEARTPISSAPFTISQPGSYYLTGNLTVSTGHAITIATSGVTLDLNGFFITSTAASAAGTAILIQEELRDITIRHGHIRSGVTSSGAGMYSGSGFGYGIAAAGFTPLANVLISGISVSGCLQDGINVSSDGSTTVESCNVQTVGGSGIVGSTIKDCVVLEAGFGISGRQVSDSRSETSGSGTGISAYTVQNCFGSSAAGWGIVANNALNCQGLSSAAGYGIYVGGTAQNCLGTSVTGIGLFAGTAQNSAGSSNGPGAGLSANVAQNCTGTSISGNGLTVSYSASNCYGDSVSAVGLNSNYTATASYGRSGSAFGLSAVLATGCFGSSSSSHGLSANEASSCQGLSSSGRGLSASVATSCYGNTTTGPYGLYVDQIATNCFGSVQSGSGIGLFSGHIANSSRGLKGGVTSVTTTFKYNMP